MSRSLIAIFIGVVLLPPLTNAKAQPVDPDALAKIVRTAPPAERYDAVSRAIELGKSRHSPALKTALVDELIRVNQLAQRRIKEPRRLQDDWDSADIGEYTALLVTVNAQSGDASAMPALIGAMGTGLMAIRAVARYGDAALQPLVAALVDRDADLGVRGGASRALGILVSEKRLNPAQIEELVKAIRTILMRAEHFVVVAPILDLAVRTGDRESIALVKQIASDPKAAKLLKPDDGDLRNIQSRAQRALGGAALKR